MNSSVTNQIENWDKALGQRLREWRQSVGLSQTEVGSALGVSFQMIQKYEKGESRLPTESILQLVRTFHAEAEIIEIDCDDPLNPRSAKRSKRKAA